MLQNKSTIQQLPLDVAVSIFGIFSALPYLPSATTSSSLMELCCISCDFIIADGACAVSAATVSSLMERVLYQLRLCHDFVCDFVSIAGLLCTSRSLWNALSDPVFDGVGLACFKSRANVFLLA